MKLIGVSGKRGSGKDTFAGLLRKHYVGFSSAISFAEKLKTQVMKDFNLSKEQVYTELKEVVDPRYNKTPRDILISIAECYRSIDPAYWVKGIEDSFDLRGDVYFNRLYIVTDLRYPNEAEYLKSKGGMLIRLNRSEKLNVYGKNLEVYGEQALDDYKGFSYILDASQNETLEQLEVFAKKIASILLKDIVR